MVQWWRICLPVQETQETWVLFLGQGQSPGEGNGNPLQYSCLGNPVDRGAWWATVAKNQTQLTNWARTHARTHTHTHTHTHRAHADYSFSTHLYWFLLSAKHCPGCQDSKWMRHRLQSVYSHLAAINGPVYKLLYPCALQEFWSRIGSSCQRSCEGKRLFFPILKKFCILSVSLFKQFGGFYVSVCVVY